MLDRSKVSAIIKEVEIKYRKTYPQIGMVTSVSATNYDGVKEFKNNLRALAMEQPFVRARIPGKYYGLAQSIVMQRQSRNPPVGK